MNTPDIYPRITPPIRVKAASFLTDDVYFPRYIESAVAKTRQTDRQGLVLTFIYTPWVHWPETMVTYLHEDKDALHL